METKALLLKLQVHHDTLVKWHSNADFDRKIIGCFVRINFGGTIGTSIGRIEEVRTGRAYQLGNIESTKHLLISHPSQVTKAFRIANVSNSGLKESEILSWIEIATSSGNYTIPSVKEFQKLEKRMVSLDSMNANEKPAELSDIRSSDEIQRMKTEASGVSKSPSQPRAKTTNVEDIIKKAKRRSTMNNKSGEAEDLFSGSMSKRGSIKGKSKTKSAADNNSNSSKTTLAALTSKFEELATKEKQEREEKSRKMQIRRAIKSERFENLASKFEMFAKDTGVANPLKSSNNNNNNNSSDASKSSKIPSLDFSSESPPQVPKGPSKRQSFHAKSVNSSPSPKGKSRVPSTGDIPLLRKPRKNTATKAEEIPKVDDLRSKLSHSSSENIDVETNLDSSRNLKSSNSETDVIPSPLASSSPNVDSKDGELSKTESPKPSNDQPNNDHEIVNKNNSNDAEDGEVSKAIEKKSDSKTNLKSSTDETKSVHDKLHRTHSLGDDSSSDNNNNNNNKGGSSQEDISLEKKIRKKKSEDFSYESSEEKCNKLIDHLFEDIKLVDSGDLADLEKSSISSEILKKSSTEEIRFTGDLIIQGSGNTNEAPLLTRIVLPPILPSAFSREFEDKKMKAIEKQSKRHAKELVALKNEDALARAKFEAELQVKRAQLEKEQFLEKEVFQKKILADKQSLKEQQQQQLKNIVKNLEKSNKSSEMHLANKLISQEKKAQEEFDRQISNIKKKKGDRESKKADEELINQLVEAHKKQKEKSVHMKKLEEIKLNHKHEQNSMKELQQNEKVHSFEDLKLEKDILHSQLTLNKKHLREKQFQELDGLRGNHDLSKNLLKSLQETTLRQEQETIDLVTKLLSKQQLLEREFVEKNNQVSNRSATSLYIKQKKNMKTEHLNAVKAIQKEKLSSKKKNTQLDTLKDVYRQAKEKLQKEYLSSQFSEDIVDLKVRHDEQNNWLLEEQKKRRDAIILFHQKQKNFTEEKTMQELQDLQDRLTSLSKSAEEEEILLKNIFANSNESRLNVIQETHWKQLEALQAEQHQLQHAALQEMLVATRLSRSETAPDLSKLSSQEGDSESSNDGENTQNNNQQNDNIIPQRSAEEEERLQQELIELERQKELLEKEQEEEKLKFEREREKEQMELRQRLDQEKSEVMSTKPKENDEMTLRDEYIKKIAFDTGLSEELIAKQLNVIGFNMFRF